VIGGQWPGLGKERPIPAALAANKIEKIYLKLNCEFAGSIFP
jgi:hypothetical protein